MRVVLKVKGGKKGCVCVCVVVCPKGKQGGDSVARLRVERVSTFNESRGEGEPLYGGVAADSDRRATLRGEAVQALENCRLDGEGGGPEAVSTRSADPLSFQTPTERASSASRANNLGFRSQRQCEGKRHA